MISSTANAFDKLKKDLESKTQELRECQNELYQIKQSVQGLDPNQRRKLISDMSYMVETCRFELLKLKTIIKRTPERS